MSSYLKRGENAMGNIVDFYRSLNDIIIYVEDTDKSTEKFYTSLLKRCLEGSRIERIFPCGNYKEVEKKSIELKDSNEKRLLIIDGDLSLLKGINKSDKDLKLLHLNKYCIENYVICKKAISKIFLEESYLSEEEVEDCLKFNDWVKINSGVLLELFTCFANISEHGIPNVKLGYSPFISTGDGNLCNVKVNSFISKHNELLSKYKEPSCGNPIGKLNYVSAKDFILPLILKRIQQFCSYKDLNNFRIKLALHSDINELKDEIENFLAA